VADHLTGGAHSTAVVAAVGAEAVETVEGEVAEDVTGRVVGVGVVDGSPQLDLHLVHDQVAPDKVIAGHMQEGDVHSLLGWVRSV
jgi:hypothetical protein